MNYSSTSGLTLLELLVTMALLACFAAMTLPTWKTLSERTNVHGASSLLLSGLEQARMAALEQHAATWVAFQHSAQAQGDHFCILQKKEDASMKPLTAWIKLPAPAIFNPTPESIMSEQPSLEVIQALPFYFSQEDDQLGALQYNEQGVITHPALGGNSLQLDLTTTLKKQIRCDSIFFSRFTGRAASKQVKSEE